MSNMNTNNRSFATRLALTVISILFLAGCGGGGHGMSPEDEAYVADKPVELQGLYRKVVADRAEDRVMNLVRAGLAAMELGYHDPLARDTFDEALLIIEAVYSDNPQAVAARKKSSPEDRKVFRGEPYERAMAYYYRGILYLMEEDYENARASFQSGVLQDTLAEQEEFRGDFALLDYLAGWSSQCNGDTALINDSYDWARENSSVNLSIPDSNDNLVVLADFGYAPTKVRTGEHGHLLKIRKNQRNYSSGTGFRLDGQAERLANSESVLWQAKTRGGREFDVILEGKARYKDDMESASGITAGIAEAGAMLGATGLLTDDDNLAQIGGGIGGIFGLASLVTGAAAEATQPQADIRQWDNLPELVRYGTYRVQGTSAITGLPGTVHLGGGERCQVAWVRYPATDLSDVQ